MAKRVFDMVFAAVMLLLFSLPAILIAAVISLTSPGPVIYWSDRIGKDGKIFCMPKFRSMRVDTPVVATHLMDEPDKYLTRIGAFLRKSSLDELPQLWSILIGDMSVVGPRPALHNQNDLIKLRAEVGADKLLPGLTGWAQINGRDELPIPEKVNLDAEYTQRQSFWLDLKIIYFTVARVLSRKGVSH